MDRTLFLDSNIKERFNSSLKNRVKEPRFNNTNSKLNYEIFSKFIMISTKDSASVLLK